MLPVRATSNDTIKMVSNDIKGDISNDMKHSKRITAILDAVCHEFVWIFSSLLNRETCRIFAYVRTFSPSSHLHVHARRLEHFSHLFRFRAP